MNWKKSFETDVLQKLSQAKSEFSQFQKTQMLLYLQQAGNKLFSAIKNYLMIKYNTKVKSYIQLRKLVANNEHDLKLLRNAVQLHYFFYNADVQMDRIDAQRLYAEVLHEFESQDHVTVYENEFDFTADTAICRNGGYGGSDHWSSQYIRVICYGD